MQARLLVVQPVLGKSLFVATVGHKIGVGSKPQISVVEVLQR